MTGGRWPFYDANDLSYQGSVEVGVLAGRGSLLDDANLGRLQCSVLDGDLDLNGAHEQLHCYGGRSFSIHDAYGNHV